MPLVAGVDSSTQSCKVVVCDATTGRLVRQGRAPHPPGTEVDPSAWERALEAAITAAGSLDGVSAIAVAGQQHGMVALDDNGAVVRPALLWNDTRSAGAATDLVHELGGGQAWADAVGVVPVASFTITKLRWLATQEPDHARRVAAVCLPHDWLSWRLSGSTRMADLFTDRSDASGTGYWSPTGGYRHDLLELALGHVPAVPRVAEPAERLGTATEGAVLAPGAGDNAAAALGLAAEPGDVIVSLGTSGVASAVSNTPSRDGAGVVAGFADATGRFLPLACTLNAAQVLDATADMLGVTHDRLSELALSAPSGCDGLVLVPYLQGERTPDRPFATGALHGLTLSTMSAAHFARASVEGMLCGVADALDALGGQGVPLRRVLLVGGAARSPAVQALAPVVFGCPVVVPAAADHVAEGAARQAAWVLSGDAQPPMWSSESHQVFEAEHDPSLRVRYAEAREHVLDRRRSES